MTATKRLAPLLLFLASIFFFSCQQQSEADLIILANHIQTVDSTMSVVQGVAIVEGSILATGTKDEMMQFRTDKTKVLDVGDAFVMPGFIEGHGHFSGLGASLVHLNFLKSKSWQDIVTMVKEKAENTPKGAWIYGRGWHQDKWDKEPDDALDFYPKHGSLSEISPDNPVILFHASGHSLFANAKAMEIVGISKELPDPKGGHIVRDEDGNAIGVFEERAMELIREGYKKYLAELDETEKEKQWYEEIELAMAECVSNGITSFQDAGSYFKDCERYEQMAEDGKLKIRLWSMIRHSSEELKDRLADYRKINIGNGFYTCRAIKTEVDGALGSYGAWLLRPYDDKPGFEGQNTTEISEVAKLAKMAADNDMQLCIHAIGDRANREVLDIIEEHAPGTNQRWRIEHAQHLHPDDIPRFTELGVIASMQGVHCTSDAPFVTTRLGEIRSKLGAYVWKSLIEAGALVVNGTDAPVEDVDPIASFYASVTRKRSDNGLEFFTEQKMSRAEAIRSYTINAAYAAYEEVVKGSLEEGKYADLVILDTDLMNCTDDEILNTKVLYTIVDGKVVFEGE